MKSLIACLAAVLALAGCVAVPYYGEPGPPAYYNYYGPPGAVYFNYGYRGGGGHHHHHRRR